MAEYQAIYRCRLCGEEFSENKVDETMAFGITVALGCGAAESFDIPSMNTIIYKTTTHECKDGSYGLADLQGLQKAED